MSERLIAGGSWGGCYHSSKRRRSSGVVPLFFFQAGGGIRDRTVTGVQTCALPISRRGCVEFRRMKFEHNRVAGMLVLSVALLGAVGWPQAPPSSVLSLARSPDGKRLATGSN